MKYSFLATVALVGLTAAAASGQVRVDRASPARIQLDAGGAPDTIRIEGANLATVTAVRVLRSGREASGVQATLGRAAAANRAGRAARVPTSGRRVSTADGIAIALQAEASAPGGRYTLEVVAGRQRIEVPGVTISVAASAPDPAPTPPSVSGASQTQVTLQAEGPSVTVLLEGDLLDDLTDAWVERSGTRMDGQINATLQPATDSTLRQVELIAFANAGPPWGGPRPLVLQASFDGRSIEVTTPVVITVPAPAVDLVIGSCSFENHPYQDRMALATLTNNGSEGVSFDSNDIMATASGAGPAKDIRAPAGGRFIPPGGSVDLVTPLSLSGVEAGPQAVTWTADPTGDVLEANGLNNGKWCPFEWEGPPPPTPPSTASEPLPDVVISRLTVEPNTGPPSTRFVVKAVYRNAGVAGPPPNHHLGVSNLTPTCTINGERLYWAQRRENARWITPSGQTLSSGSVVLFPGLSGVYQFELPTGMSPGSKTLECEAGYPWDEITTDNNGNFYVFTVGDPNP